METPKLPLNVVVREHGEWDREYSGEWNEESAVIPVSSFHLSGRSRYSRAAFTKITTKCCVPVLIKVLFRC